MYSVSSLCCCRPLTVECEAVVGSIYSRAAEVKVVMGHANQGKGIIPQMMLCNGIEMFRNYSYRGRL